MSELDSSEVNDVVFAVEDHLVCDFLEKSSLEHCVGSVSLKTPFQFFRCGMTVSVRSWKIEMLFSV